MLQSEKTTQADKTQVRVGCRCQEHLLLLEALSVEELSWPAQTMMLLVSLFPSAAFLGALRQVCPKGLP